MDRNQYESLINVILRQQKYRRATSKNFSEPKDDSIKSILGERKWQRKCIFWFSVGWATFSLLLFTAIVAIQIYARIYIDDSFSVFDGAELQLIAVAVFGQILGIIYLIASKVWDNKDYIKFYS
jgi:hypothetical protein